MTSDERRFVFISYSHNDERWLNELLIQLAPYERDDSIRGWTDKQIEEGADYLLAIQAAMAAAKAAVLLVTPDFLASKFIMEEELPRLESAAEAGQVKILWIHVRACAYDRSSLRDCQAVIEPDKPLDEMTKPQRGKAWVRICKAIEKAVAAPEPPHAVEDQMADRPDEELPGVVEFHGLTRLLRDMEESIRDGELQASSLGPVVLQELKRSPAARLMEPYDLSWIERGIRKSDYYFDLVRPSAGQMDWERDFAQTATPILVGVARSLEPSPNMVALVRKLCDAVADQLELQIIWPKAGALQDTDNAIYGACQQATELENDDVLAELKGLIVVGRF